LERPDGDRGRCVGAGEAPVTGEAVRFGIVGLIQNALNVTVFALATGAGVHYRLAAVVAALAALVVSFAFNRAWTFPGRGGPVHHQGARYALVFASAVALGVVVLTFFVEVGGLPEVAAQVVAIVIVAPLSFLAQRTWVFRAGPGPRAASRRSRPAS
jgi:putative flippase GtrA